jgi:hypothetical protein
MSMRNGRTSKAQTDPLGARILNCLRSSVPFMAFGLILLSIRSLLDSVAIRRRLYLRVARVNWRE